MASAITNTQRKQFPSPKSSVSIHASLPQRGEPEKPTTATEEKRGFNPRLTSAARRTLCAAGDSGDHLAFQSTPHFRSEANRAVIAAVNHAGPSFNPRLTSAARRTCRLSAGFGFINVSIHASLPQRGEQEVIPVIEQAYLFQSTPHFRSEANTSD